LPDVPDTASPTPGTPEINTDWAFARYEEVRQRLPEARFPKTSIRHKHTGELAEAFDVFVLDAFGVLNVGETALRGAPERIAALQAMGKEVYVLTNGATYNAEKARAKYARLGFSFEPSRIIASRDVLSDGLAKYPSAFRWGFMATADSQVEELAPQSVVLADDPATYDEVDGFVLLSSIGWTDARQKKLIQALTKNKRPVLVGNPDIVAPREESLSLEPGFYAHDLADRTGIAPLFFGKPFRNAFDEVIRRVARDRPGVPPERIAMVGDTLHTDILGGAAAGFKTILVTDYGLFRGHPIASYIAASKIVPDFIVATT